MEQFIHCGKVLVHRMDPLDVITALKPHLMGLQRIIQYFI